MKVGRIMVLLLILVALSQVLLWSEPTAAGDNSGESLPFTFFITRYEYVGNPSNPTGAIFHNDGQEFANASDGSSVIISGQGAWDPAYYLVEGGGIYTIKDPAGVVKAQGWWKAINFTSFLQWPGWVPQGFTMQGWQGPPGSVSFAGNLTLTVDLENLGNGVLALWCIMVNVPPVVPPPHYSDAMSLIVGGFSFTNSTLMEMNPYDGNMFYTPGCCSQPVGTPLPPSAITGNIAAPDQWGWSWYVPVALAAGFIVGIACVSTLRRRQKKAAVEVD